MRPLLSIFSVLAAIMATASAGDGPKTEKKPVDPVGRPAYAFTLDSLDGVPVKLADYKGKVVLIDFFETWCPGCNAMMPAVVGMSGKYKDQGLIVLGIDREKRGDKPDAIKKFIAKHKIAFPVMMLAGDAKNAIWTKYDITHGIPYYIAIDRNGVVRYKQAGGASATLEKAVKKLLDDDAISRR